MPALRVSREQARRFLRRALLLDEPVTDVGAALAWHGYVQIDPINVCGRMHDLILRNRVQGYREGDLLAYVHGPTRPGFEHYFPGSTAVLVAWPREAWPFLAGMIAKRRLRNGPFIRDLTRAHERVARHILDEIGARGPLTSDDIDHDGRAVGGWGNEGRLVKHLLEILLVHGRVLVSARRGFRRVYDLPERVLPPAVLHAPARSDEEAARFLASARLRQRRLVTLTRSELARIGDEVAEVRLDDGPVLYCLRSDIPAMERADDDADARAEARHPVLLAPLDPLIYDRRLTAALWDFDYRWEVYTPASQRVRGYYTLPVLAGTTIVGHVEPRADRTAGRLQVVSRSVRRGHATAPALDELARFLAVRR